MFFTRPSQLVIIVGLAGLLTACSSALDGLFSSSDSSSKHNAVFTQYHYDPVRHKYVSNSSNNASEPSSIGSSDNSVSAQTAAPVADDAATQDYYSQPDNDKNDLWAQMRKNFQMDHCTDNPAVQAQILWFMNHQEFLDRTARRAAPFMYYIHQAVKSRNLPSELVLLPIIESAYNPFVTSSANAAGLWQLVPGTGRTFGVRQDWWYDGRRDITASTNAALDYLTYLQNFFGGNWILAIAAYNTGEGNVEAAIRHNARLGVSTDFWYLPLSAQTQSYVPRLLALAAIVQDPNAYHIALPPISNAPYLGEVDISSQITLDTAANLAGISLDELKTLNPGYRGDSLDPNEPYKLLLPIDRIPIFKANLLQRPAEQGSLWGHYKVQSGDTWRSIAKRFSTSYVLLQDVNHLRATTPPVGQVILIPESSNNEGALAAAATTQDFNTNSNTAADNTTNTTDSAIATTQISNSTDNTTDASNNSLSTSNSTATTTNSTDNTDSSDTTAQPNLADAASLDASAMDTVDKSNLSATTKIFHTVKSGETLASIARTYKVSTTELILWNHISAKRPFKHGMIIVILRPGHRDQKIQTRQEQHIQTSMPHATASVYIVRTGDTLDSIAKREHVNIKELAQWNGLTSHSRLHAGQKIVIRK